MSKFPISSEYDQLRFVPEKFGGTEKENEPERQTPKVKLPKRPYAELRAASAFSFLDGASLPEDLVYWAAQRDVPAMALVDTNGVYGAPRFYGAAKKAGIRALVGAELVLECGGHATALESPTTKFAAGPERSEGPPTEARRLSEPTKSGGTAAALQRKRAAVFKENVILDPERNEGSTKKRSGSFAAPAAQDRAILLVENQLGYRNLCKLITAGAANREKGKARFTWELIEQYAEGLHCLTRDDDATIGKIAAIFNGRTHIELQRHSVREEEHHNQRLIALARKLKLPLVATNGVRYARPEDKQLHDVLTCVREGRHVDNAGRLLGINRERHIKGAEEMCALFKDVPEAVSNAWELSQRLDFTLANLGYQFPQYPLPPGESDMSFLRKIAWNGATARFRPLTGKAQAQIEKELAMIEKLDLAGYFLIVWDVVQFCQREKIMVQGRGSAANSAVCYALSLTAVDPVKMELLFERFLSEERGEWPDIDLDLPSGDQREKVIQHVYKTYGAHGAAMTANVITYRDRSAAREVGKALGFSLEQADKLSKCVATYHFGEIREAMNAMGEQLAAIGFDPADLRVQHFMRLQMQIQNLPRHLGQHSGGMVMARGRLDEVVPLEPASMPGRVVIQWDKDDCADLGIIKVDLLGLGMLQAIEEAIPLIRDKEGVDVDLAHLPPDDPVVYKMLNEADTVGMFQVESRAQMSSLPRHAPKCFYDIVVQVAIIRPGPIVGGMIRPFFDRRQGKVPVEYPHPCLEPILKRTLGVPLFQEQLLRIAMVAANFTGGEAEELRRAMGFKRSMERMEEIEKRLRAGMTKNGIDQKAQEQIVKSITSFALYGFPESHAASFALIAYASAYLKAHHPAVFYISLLNAWPMGFYHPATLIKDAQRHGVRVLPVDVNHSGWRCRWEDGAVRLGLRFVKGLREQTGKAIESAQMHVTPSVSEGPGGMGGTRTKATSEDHCAAPAARPLADARGDNNLPFASTDDLAYRAKLRDDQLTKLAYAGALASLGLRRRAALWQAAQSARDAGELFQRVIPSRKDGEESPSQARRGSLATLGMTQSSPLKEMSRGDETLADYDSMQLTTGPHLIQYFRKQLKRDNVLSALDLKRIPNGHRVTTAGAVIVRQRPGTAKGFVFLTLEDETGMSQAIVHPNLFREHRSLIVSSPGLIVEGILQNTDGQCSVKAEKFWPLEGMSDIASHDFY